MKLKENMRVKVFCWMQEKHFLLYGGNTLGKYTVKFYDRAYRDLDSYRNGERFDV